MLKKLLVSLLSALLCISVVAEPESQSNENQNGSDVKIDENGFVFVSPLWYRISSDSTAEVIKDYSYEKLESVVIPSEIQVYGHVYSVTSIGDESFYGCRRLKSIKILSSVISIGDGAFSYCSGLTSIEIPSSVTNIEKNTFEGCSGLTNIKIPSGVTSIGSRAFMDCENLEIVIDNSKENVTVGEDAFKNCKSVTYLK